MPDNKYPKQCFKMLKTLDDVGMHTWASKVKQLLFRYGFGIAWITQDIGQPDVFLLQFKQTLVDCMSQNWHSSIDNSPRCDSYRQFKTLLNVEKYLTLDLPFKYKQALARFRCSSHKLKIQTGRHVGIDREFRYCQFCIDAKTYT